MAQATEDEETKKPENKSKNAVPRYRVNLDDPPNKRWQTVINDYKDHFKRIEKIINALISEELGKTGTFLKSLVLSTMSTLTKCGAVYYKDELKAIANQSNMSLGLLVVMQLIYEASAHCTSIVCNDSNGKPIHIRTMDWEMAFLRPMTIEVEFYRNDKAVCVATSWAGYVGILTGLRYGENGFSVSVNFRVTGDVFWKNLKKGMTGSWPIGFLVRETLTQEAPTNFQSAKSILQQSALIAPVYFTMSGCNKNEGCLITRDRESDTKFLQLSCQDEKEDLDGSSSKDFIVQTNIDHWSDYWADNIMWSIQRRSVACERLKEINNKTSYDKLWQLVTEHPICNDITVYGSLMSVSDAYFETRLPHKINGFMVGKNDKNEVGDEDNEWITCKKCAAKYYDGLNAKGECEHVGDWHSEYSDCDKLQCALGLTTNIGKRHWSCCYSVEYDSKCEKSGKHEPMANTVKLGVGGYECDDDVVKGWGAM